MRRFAACLACCTLLAAAVTAAPVPRPKTLTPSPKPVDPVRHFYSCLGKGGTFDHPEAVIRVKGTDEGGRLLRLTVECKRKNDGNVIAVYKAREGDVAVSKDGKGLLIRL